MYRVFEHYLGYWGFLANFQTREEAEQYVTEKKWEHPRREYDIEG